MKLMNPTASLRHELSSDLGKTMCNRAFNRAFSSLVLLYTYGYDTDLAIITIIRSIGEDNLQKTLPSESLDHTCTDRYWPTWQRINHLKVQPVWRIHPLLC